MRRSPLDPALLKFPHVVSGREQAALRLDDLSQQRGSVARVRAQSSGSRPPVIACRARPIARWSMQRGVLVARLATSEFLVEAVDGGSERVDATLRQLAAASRPANVYPVARQDMVVGIQGPGIQTLLRQICSVDFVPLFESCGPAAGPVVSDIDGGCRRRGVAATDRERLDSHESGSTPALHITSGRRCSKLGAASALWSSGATHDTGRGQEILR